MRIVRPNLPSPGPDLEYAPSDPRAPMGLALLERVWPSALSWAENTVEGWAPLRWLPGDMTSGGCTCGRFQDTRIVFSTINSIEGGMEGMLHEAGHIQVHDHGINLDDWAPDALLNDPTDLYASPYRHDIQRSIGAVLHGQYSYLWVMEWYQRLLASGEGFMSRDRLVVRAKEITPKLIAGYALLAAHIRPAPKTEPFVRRVLEWSQAVIAAGP